MMLRHLNIIISFRSQNKLCRYGGLIKILTSVLWKLILYRASVQMTVSIILPKGITTVIYIPYYLVCTSKIILLKLIELILLFS